MKKHISLILLASMAVTLFTGCREIPDAPAELQKDQEQMLQTAEQGRDNSALLAALDVPGLVTGDLKFDENGDAIKSYAIIKTATTEGFVFADSVAIE